MGKRGPEPSPSVDQVLLEDLHQQEGLLKRLGKSCFLFFFFLKANFKLMVLYVPKISRFVFLDFKF